MDILIEELEGSLWVAALEKGRIDGLEVDPVAEEVRWGSIYWAKVARIDASLDAAFVNLDGDNIGILHNADVRVSDGNGGWTKGGDVAIGKLIQPGEMIAVQAKGGYLPKDPSEPFAKAEHKSPRLSMHIVLPGRYMLYAPMESENRVSQRIRDKKMRAQLLKMLGTIDDCTGCILRASAADVQTDMLVRESRILSAMWAQLQTHFEGTDPTLIMLGPDAIQRMLSDHAAKNIINIDLTTLDHFEYVEEWCDIFAPDLVPKIKAIELDNAEEGFALFEHRDLIGQIEDLFQPYVIMDGGSTLVFQETAAAMVVDVNSGADNRGKLAINIDAAHELARQMRLRNLGGAIIIDFLKMKDKKEEQKLVEALEAAFATDPCTVQIHGMTGLGFMEVTRHQRTPALSERFESVLGD